MWLDSLLTYAHFMCVFGLFAVLILESVIIKPTMTKAQVQLMSKTDGWYGLLSILVLLTGFLRVYYFGKGPDYYFANTLLWIKLGLFTIIGLLSILPTVRFMKLKKLTDDEIEIKDYGKLKNIIRVEIILLFFIPLAAVFMANGANF